MHGMTQKMRRSMILTPLLPILLLACGESSSPAQTDGGGGSSGSSGSGSGGAGAGAGTAGSSGTGTRPPDPASGFDQRPVNNTCTASQALPASAGAVRVERAFPNLSFSKLTGLVHHGSRWWVIEKSGLVKTFNADNSVSEAATALDIRSQVESGPNEMGLLAITVAPDFAASGRLYVMYTAKGFESRISRFTSDDGGLSFDNEQVLLQFRQRHENHNGGHLAFGPDNMIYASFGDGGAQNDPDGHGQNPFTWFSTVLRIDVSGGGADYTIPSDNPFADGVHGAPEVWAYGFRNPWRFSFDRGTGTLFLADVGGGEEEEVNRVEKGGNYGWPHREGNRCNREPCDNPDYIHPVLSYKHSEFANLSQPLSVVGGHVYRGSIPSLQGVYVFSDVYQPAPIWGIVYNEQGDPEKVELASFPGNISAFAEDADGELYIGSYSGGIHKITSAEGGTGYTFPAKLSDTGCARPENPTLPAEGLVPFGVNMELWSDGADKKRWAALPHGTGATTLEDGDLDFPNGTVLVKEFSRGGKRLETRLLVKHHDGTWAGYPYRWNSDETDAVLVPEGADVPTDQGTWHIPSQAECLSCHTVASGGALGPELGQLNGDFHYARSGRTANQLYTWAHITLLESDPGPPTSVPAMATLDGNGSTGDIARAYLHTNCANCHRPGGMAQSDFDLRWQVKLEDTGICGTDADRGDMGVPNAKILAPGHPEQSVMTLRMRDLSDKRMPNIGSTVVDTQGVEAVENWIRALKACP